MTRLRAVVTCCHILGLRRSAILERMAFVLEWISMPGKSAGLREAAHNRFVVDYLAPSVRLVVEVDGKYHSRRVLADARRDRVLQRLGYRVLRLDAELVRYNLVEAVARVRVALSQV